MIQRGGRFRGRRALVLIAAGPVLALGLLASVPPSSGQQSGDLDDQLTKVRGQIVDLKARLEAESKKEATILSSLDRISLNKSILKSELDLYGLEMAKAGREQEALRRGLPALQAKLKKEKDSIGATLVTLYKYGRFSPVQFFFQSQDLRLLASESKSLTLLARYQQDILHSYQVDLSRLNTSQRALDIKRAELQGLIEAAKTKRKELEGQEARNKRRIDEIQQNKTLYQQTLNELNERARELQLLMDKLAKQEVEFPAPFVPLYDRKGKLPWPVPGRVITRFGLERHPQFNTSTKNNGIEIAPETRDAVVRAVHAGRVVYADYFQGYGNLLILDHGLSYYSLYGHCASFLAKKGDWVTAAQPLGLAGDVGSLKGVCLYLEIRYKAQPLNPLQWLERR